MSQSEGMSLLAHLQAPILVGDPDGRIVYANAAFRSRFGTESGDPMGQPLAMVFGGGAREVVLSATARVLQRGQSARLQIREGGFGYTGLASPIEAEDDRVGVVMVLLEEQATEEHLTGLADEVGEPLAEALQALHALSENIGDGLSPKQRTILDRGLSSLETAQKWLRELHVALRGGKAQAGRFDVGASILRVTERVRYEIESGVDLEVLMPPNLPRAAGTTVVFERILTQLIRRRVEEARAGQPLTVLARVVGGHDPNGVLVSVVDLPDPDQRRATGHPPDVVQQGIASLGGDVACVEDSSLGRVTSLRLAIANT
jgi:PAS domain-containing protein